MNNKSQQPQGNNPAAPPDYMEATKDVYPPQYAAYPQGYSQPPSAYQQGYSQPPGAYPQGYSQPPGTYPPQQGGSQSAEYPSTKPGYATQYGTQQGFNHPNYASYPQEQPYFPQTQANNSQMSVIVTQQQILIQPLKNYMGLAILSLFLFWPTGIVAIIKANEAQTQNARGNVTTAQACNETAMRFIKISGILFVVSVIIIAGTRIMLYQFY